MTLSPREEEILQLESWLFELEEELVALTGHESEYPEHYQRLLDDYDRALARRDELLDGDSGSSDAPFFERWPSEPEVDLAEGDSSSSDVPFFARWPAFPEPGDSSAGAAAPVAGRGENVCLALPDSAGEKFRKFAEGGHLQQAVHHMNGLSMGDMVSYTDRLQAGTLDALEDAIARIDGYNRPRMQFAVDVVRSRKIPEGHSRSDSDIQVVKRFLRCRKWLDKAKEELNVRENLARDRYPEGHPREGQLIDLDSTSNSRIVEYHAAAGLGTRTPDSVPWCSSFVNWVMREVDEERSGRATARSWGVSHQRFHPNDPVWGKSTGHPVYGAIGVVWGRDGKDGRNDPQGHVGFIVGRTRDHKLVLLGGNQDELVKYSAEKRKVSEYRVPSDYEPLAADYHLPVLEAEDMASDR